MAIQHSTAQVYDISTMSRAGRLQEARWDQPSPTMSYPQRIATMLAHAPKPPALHRAAPETPAPLTDETRAMLISVHTLNATLGYPPH